MATRKEEEKNERMIRSLLKLPENRRCINCNSLGPQYVCTNFWTFVCTTCSGIHREFTHRVKSVSMAKFTSQEVSALQGGGNASAKVIYLKEWDAQRNSFPDNSNVDRLRDFIKHVYVDRRYTGERSLDKPPRIKGDSEDFSERGSRSPPFEDTYGRSSGRSSPGGRSDDKNYRSSYNERRSPGYGQESRSYGDYRKSPSRTEIVNDWRRDDRFGNGRRSEDGSISDGGSKLEGRSPDRESDRDMASPPMVRPVRDILGDNVSPLRVIEPPKANGGRSMDGSIHTQRTASSSSLTSSNENPAEIRLESSLIDFNDVPQASVTPAAPQSQQTFVGVSVAQPPASSNVDNWANFDSPAGVKLSQAPSNFNPLESVLSELSAPASLPGHPTGIPGMDGALVTAPLDNTLALPSRTNTIVAPGGQMSVLPVSGGIPSTGPVSSSIAFFPGGAAAIAPRPVSVLPVNGGNSISSGQWAVVQPQQPSLFPAGSQPTAHFFTPAVGGASNIQPAGVEVKSGGRQALSEDIFTVNYSQFPGPVLGWQTGPPQGFGFSMPYNNAAPIPTFSLPFRSTNPFDFGNDSSPPVQASTFPSMSSLQGALPNMTASNIGNPPSTWMPPQPYHPLAMPHHPPSHASTMPPSSYMGQQVTTNMSPRQQGVMNFDFEGTAFGNSNPNQQLNGLYSAPATLNPFPSGGGNPFG